MIVLNPLQKGEFDWSQEEVGWVLSAFYVGYIFTQFVGGFAAARFGAKLVLGGCKKNLI